MKKEIETNKENYVKELQKLIQINKNRFLKSLENTREGMIMINEKDGIEFASFEKEMKKDKEFANKVKDLLKSIEKFMED